MINDLFLCRMAMRIYSFCSIDTQTNELIYDPSRRFLNLFFSIEKFVRESFLERNILYYPHGNKSSFEGEIKIVPEVAFIYTKNSYPIPSILIDRLKSFLESKGKIVPVYKKQ